MKLIYLHQYFSTPDANSGIRSYETAKRFVNNGDEVVVITSSAFLPSSYVIEPGWNYFKIDGIDVWALDLPYSNRDPLLKRILIFFKFLFFSTLKARSISCDAVLATSTPLTIAIPGVSASRKWSAPLFFEVRDCWPAVPIAMGIIRWAPFKFLVRKFELWAYKNAHKIIALSSGMKERIIQTGISADDITVIPNASDIDLFHVERSAGLEYRKQYKWLIDRPFVVYTGTFGRVNNLSYLVEVAYYMSSLNPDVRFALLGSGGEEEKIRSLAKDLNVFNKNLFFLPPVAKKELPIILSAADISISTVLPIQELWDNSANKFFDAFAAGRPIAINHLGWQANVISKHDVGVVMDYKSAESGALSLSEALSDVSWLKGAKSRAKKLGKEKYSRDLLFSKLNALFENI